MHSKVEPTCGMSYDPYSFSALLPLSTPGKDSRIVAKECPFFVVKNVRLQEDKRWLLDLVEGVESKSQMSADHVKIDRFSLANRERAVKTAGQNIQSVCF